MLHRSCVDMAYPAAFFVSTGVDQFGASIPARHQSQAIRDDPQRCRRMQLRAMRRWRFTIGSHTVEPHRAARAEPKDVVGYELARSRQDLKERLGASANFQLPYGGRRHMTAERWRW